jgi:hypothetical protein
MLMWTLDKFVRPAHAAAVYKAFYRLPLRGRIFSAAWPMLAACVTLYALRDLDTLGVVEQWSRPRGDRVP